MDYKEQNERAQFIEYLYHRDGRDYPKHPEHGTYSGLYAEWVAEQVAAGKQAWREEAAGSGAFVRPIADRTRRVIADA